MIVPILDDIVSETSKKYDLQRKEFIDKINNETSSLLAYLKEKYSIQDKAAFSMMWLALVVLIVFYLTFISFDITRIFLYFKLKNIKRIIKPISISKPFQKVNKANRNIEEDKFEFIKLKEADLNLQRKLRKLLHDRNENI